MIPEHIKELASKWTNHVSTVIEKAKADLRQVEEFPLPGAMDIGEQMEMMANLREAFGIVKGVSVAIALAKPEGQKVRRLLDMAIDETWDDCARTHVPDSYEAPRERYATYNLATLEWRLLQRPVLEAWDSLMAIEEVVKIYSQSIAGRSRDLQVVIDVGRS